MPHYTWPMQTADPSILLETISKDQRPVLSNLFELYAHDFSEHVPLEIKANGRFDVGPDERWWAGGERYAFFIRWNGGLAGFALVERGSRVTDSAEPMDVAEFFVARGARGRRIGTTVAHTLFRAYPGPWELRIRRANRAAMKFWSRATESWTPGAVKAIAFSSEGVDWDLLSIDSSKR